MIYFDNCATTRVDDEVAALVSYAMTEEYGNPSSLHMLGTQALNLLVAARHQIAKSLAAPTRTIHFTSGGTEANNLAILGALKNRPGKTIVTTAIEHASVLELFRRLGQQGYKTVFVAPGKEGRMEAEAVVDAVDEDTALVSMMAVNNETGEILPVAKTVEGVKKRDPSILFHCDAVQGFGKLPIKIHELGADLITVSGHKIHGPKGAGALYVREGVPLEPLVTGGGQERRLRPGTEAVPALAGFGLAADMALANMKKNSDHTRLLKNITLDLLAKNQLIQINSPAGALPYVLNLSVKAHSSEALLHQLSLNNIYLSSSSACERGAKSHVLAAMALPASRIDGALRIGFSRYNTVDEVERFSRCLLSLIRP